MKFKISKNTKNLVTSILIILIIFSYIYINYNRFVSVTANTIHDSALQVQLAMSLSHGKWLGSYNEVVLAKGLSFPFLLTIFHFFNLPFIVGISLFNILCTSLFLLVIIPFFNHKRIATLLILILLLYNPITFSYYQVIPYRDSSAYGAMVLIIGWTLGFVLNYVYNLNKLSLISSILCGCLGFPYWSNLREDSSWIYPFIIISFLVVVLYSFKVHKNNLKSMFLALLLPLLVLGLENIFIGWNNYNNYGRFVVNEYRSKDFKEAIGTMYAVRNNKWVINVPVNTKAREAMYRNVPLFKSLKPYLDSNIEGNMQGFKQYGVKEPSLGVDYQGGWFPWAYRGAVYKSGHANNSRQFKKFNEDLANQIVEASKKGKIDGPKHLRRSLVAPFTPKIIKPILAGNWGDFKTFILMKDYIVEVPVTKEFNKPLQNDMAKYLKAKYPLATGNSKKHKIVYLYKDIYVIGQIIVLLGGIILCIQSVYHQMINGLHKWFKYDWLLLIWLGLFLSVILRFEMLVYVSVTSFNAILTTYMSSNYALLVLLMVTTFLLIDQKKVLTNKD